MIATAAWGDVTLWSAAVGRPTHTISYGERRSVIVTCLAFSPVDSNILVVGTNDDKFTVWQLSPEIQQMKVVQMPSPLMVLHCVAWSFDGQLLAVGCDERLSAISQYKVNIFDARSNFEKLCLLEGHTGPIWSISFSPSAEPGNNVCATASGAPDNTLRVWRVGAAPRCLQVLAGHTKSVRSCCWLPDGRLLSGSDDCSWRLWEIKPEAKCVLHQMMTKKVKFVAASADGHATVRADRLSARTYHFAPTSADAKNRFLHPDIIACAFSADARQVITCGDRTLRIFDVTSGEMLAEIKCDRTVTHLSVAPTLLPDLSDVVGGGDDDSALRECRQRSEE